MVRWNSKVPPTYWFWTQKWPLAGTGIDAASGTYDTVCLVWRSHIPDAIINYYRNGRRINGHYGQNISILVGESTWSASDRRVQQSMHDRASYIVRGSRSAEYCNNHYDYLTIYSPCNRFTIRGLALIVRAKMGEEECGRVGGMKIYRMHCGNSFQYHLRIS